jgi:hypothetical protein
MSEQESAAVPLRRLRQSSVVAAVVEVSFYVAIPVALFHGEWLLAALLMGAKAGNWRDALLTPQVSYLIVAAALYLAHRRGESAVFLLTAPVAIGHIAGMLSGLQSSASTTRWERYFVGVAPVAGWVRFAQSWRLRGSFEHAVAWTGAVAIGVSWTLALLWGVANLHAVWKWPYAALLIWFALWWCYLLIRVVWRRLVVPERESMRARPEGAGSPPEWHVQVLRTGAFPDLDLPRAFAGGQTEARLRLFAADCAQHALASPTEVGREPHAYVMACIDSARERAVGTLRGRSLRTAFDDAYGNIRGSARMLREDAANGVVLGRLDDATMAAYHALCAPTPMDAARYASNATAVTSEGEILEDERRWQLERLDFYRGEDADR